MKEWNRSSPAEKEDNEYGMKDGRNKKKSNHKRHGSRVMGKGDGRGMARKKGDGEGGGGGVHDSPTTDP